MTANTKVISVYRARRELATLLRRLGKTGLPICIGKKGRPKFYLIPAAMLESAQHSLSTATPKTDAEPVQVLAKIRGLRGTIPSGFKFDRDEANSRD